MQQQSMSRPDYHHLRRHTCTMVNEGQLCDPVERSGGNGDNMGGAYLPAIQICCRMKGHLDQQRNKAALEGDEIQSFTIELLQLR